MLLFDLRCDKWFEVDTNGRIRDVVVIVIMMK